MTSETQRSKEFWKVEVHSRKDKSESRIYFVFANSATEAERKALKLSKRDFVESPYCFSVIFHGYIE